MADFTQTLELKPQHVVDDSIKIDDSFELSCSSYIEDIGGGIIQQDNGCIYKINDSIMCMVSADGHCKYGELASSICVEEVQKIINESNKDEIQNNTYLLLELLFQNIQEEIKRQFLEKCSDFEIQLQLCGGSTLTIVLIVNDTIYCANVGDSDALMCIQEESTDEQSSEHILNSNHSAENEKEWRRMRHVKSKPSNPKLPYLDFKYESMHHIGASKDIFELQEDGTLTSNKEHVIQQKLSFFKNVKKELASMVMIPHSRIKLSFTRSMGDFNLQPYGVSCKPDIKTYSISEFFDKKTSPKDNDILCIVLGSDGIWDCLKHHRCSQFVFYHDCINALKTTEDGAQRVCQSFFKQIKEISKIKFGSTSDNMSMSLVYIKKNKLLII
jgi:serine/threonine protein phosphatase PrpC